MRAWSCIFTMMCAILFAACAQDRKPPPPPAQPSIEGNAKSVSAADIRVVLELKRKDMIMSHGSASPIYTVRVIDHNHIEIGYWLGGTETWAIAERVKGKWKLADYERIMVRAADIPTS